MLNRRPGPPILPDVIPRYPDWELYVWVVELEVVLEINKGASCFLNVCTCMGYTQEDRHLNRFMPNSHM